MGLKKGRQPPQEPQKKKKKKLQIDAADAGEPSALSVVSFIEGLQQSQGAPLHSTALEDDLAVADEEVVRKRKSKRAETHEEQKTEKKPKSVPLKRTKAAPATNERKSAVKRKSSGDADAARRVKRQKVKSKKDEKTSAPQPQAALEGELSSRNHRDVLSSDEELDQSWKPSPKTRKGLGPKISRKSSLDKSRKSSLGSAPEKVVEKKKRLKRSGVTETELVLEEFLDFCEQYKETVESKAVKRALDCFASNVKDQLTEKICSSKQLKTVMRENSKLASAIRTKRQRLLDAKNELNKSERQLCLLEKDKSELEQNLKDLTQSKTFLQNLRELNKRYLQHRQKNPDEKETYDASSLPALLIEAKHVQTTELQLKQINDRLQKAAKEK